MKVKQLIEKLSQEDPDKKVVYCEEVITIDDPRDCLPDCVKVTYDMVVAPLGMYPIEVQKAIDVPGIKKVIAQGLRNAYLHGQNAATQAFMKKLDSVG